MPALIQDYSAAEDIFTRALPFFAVVALFEVAGAFNSDWSLQTNLAAVLGGVAMLVASYGLFNRFMERPFFALPKRVGLPELTAFVLLPSLLPLVFGGQIGSAALTALANLVLIGLAWLVIGLGLFSIIRWAGARLFAQLAASLTLMVRALPLILFFGLVSFFAAEIWQIFSLVATPRYIATVLLFVVIGLLFLAVRLPGSVNGIEDTVDLAGTPLRRPERINLAMVILISQVLQILLVTMLVWLFFAAFGALLVDVKLGETWVGAEANQLFDFSLFGEKVVVTDQLLRSSFGIAAFSGLYYTVAMLVDATYRDEFVAELTEQMRSTFHIRANYLTLRAEETARTN
ncbi:MAG TPA: hypothetical protein VGJ86_12050 [Acidimicrobiales bacterium]|jgi:hypothetical protein